MIKKKFFRLFACCKLIRGAIRSVIIDLQRGTYETIPSDLFEVIVNSYGLSLDEILLKSDSENQNVIIDFFDFLIENEYGFWCESLSELQHFPDACNDWDNPSPITNAIIEIGSDHQIDYFSLIKQIEALAIPYIQIRSCVINEFTFYESLISALNKSRVMSIELIIPFTKNEVSIDYMKNFVKRNLRIKMIIFHSSPFNKKIKIIENLSNIYYLSQKYNSVSDCGVISPKYFTVNMEYYTESLQHNSCLNRKISIDVDGEIKNCPSMPKSYGNIKNISLQEVIKNKSIAEMWHINKDAIDVCKDCEFRHLCTDCRAYIKNHY